MGWPAFFFFFALIYRWVSILASILSFFYNNLIPDARRGFLYDSARISVPDACFLLLLPSCCISTIILDFGGLFYFTVVLGSWEVVCL